jgi:hypothetical protein
VQGAEISIDLQRTTPVQRSEAGFEESRRAGMGWSFARVRAELFQGPAWKARPLFQAIKALAVLLLPHVGTAHSRCFFSSGGF